MQTGPIILIDDDIDDKIIFQDALKELGIENELVWFEQTKLAFEYLKNTAAQPFLIISDVNMPGQSGIQFKSQIDADPDLRKRAIPFIFYSTAAGKEMVDKAFTELTVQGFFQKKHDYHEIVENIGLILNYWKHCKHPNSSRQQ